MIVCFRPYESDGSAQVPGKREVCAGETAWSVWCNNPLTARRLGLLLIFGGNCGFARRLMLVRGVHLFPQDNNCFVLVKCHSTFHRLVVYYGVGCPLP